ncbi:MAG TPA: GTPase, partial [Longimicrobiales bacterium]|nr:GTPase [Longimicrobiales bacterium]
CVRAGAREAEPGEFTRRAYLRGKVDLVEAEAIADLVEARTPAMRRAALGQLERGLSERVDRLRERVVRVEALLAHHVDFPEEDDAPVPLVEVVEEARGLVDDLTRMLATAPEGALLREGALVVFAGPPNVGKSSLYNALVGEERAIVTPEAGTTRDALEVTVQLGGFPFRLVDTAGLRSDPGRIEGLGIEVARGYLARADVVLLCVEAGMEAVISRGELLEKVGAGAVVVVVETKADLLGEGSGSGGSDGRSANGRPPVEGAQGRAAEADEGADVDAPVARVRTSATTGEGLGELRRLLPGLVYASVISAGTEQPVITRSRQAKALASAREEVGAFIDAVELGVPAEAAGLHLREAATALEEVLGVVSVDDVLDVVFREFCIGT